MSSIAAISDIGLEFFVCGFYFVGGLLKSVCMVFKPRRFKLYCPTVDIGDECSKYVDTFKYLGFVFSENKKDDADMLRQLRSLYAKANRITRMFHYCTVDVKLLLIKSYCTSFYCGYL